jgi:uncharacterized RDD family membrane protein YckC
MGAGAGAGQMAEGQDRAEMILQAVSEGGSIWASLIGVLYALIEGITGASPGKMILGIQIRSADGSVAGPGLLIPRFLIKGIATVLGFVALLTGIASITYVGLIGGLVVVIGCFFALAESKQALHDRIIGTAVYQKAE